MIFIKMTGHGKSQEMLVSDKGPWRDFKDTLEQLGCRFVTELESKSIDALIVNNFSRYSKKLAKKFKIKKHRMVYIIWEPKVVDPRRYRSTVVKNFGVIFSPSSLWIKGVNVKYFNWPQVDFNKIDLNFSNWSKRKNKSVIIAANKFSVCEGELYSLRRNLSTYTTANNSLDLFGHDWNKGFRHDMKLVCFSILKSDLKNLKWKSIKGVGKFHQNYCGSVTDKFEKIRDYKVSIVIENSSDYVSEKLFDSILCGAITVYIGPPLEIFGLSEDVAIIVPPDAMSISNTIDRLLALPAHEQQLIAQKQLKALLPYADQWEGSNVLTTLARDIFIFLNKQSGY
jgi:hypothetical protein